MGDLDEGPIQVEEEKDIQVPAKIKSIIDKVMSSHNAKQTVSACLIGVVLVGGSIGYFNYRNAGYEVRYDGRLLGYVKSKDSTVEAFNRIREQLKTYDPNIDISDKLEFDKVMISPSKLTSESDIEKNLESGLYMENTYYSIAINGDEIAIVASEDEASQVVEGIKQYYKDQETKNGAEVLNISINDDIKISEKIASASKVMDQKSVVDKIIAGKGTTKKYDVKQGDSIWKIARDNDMTVEAIAAVNPGLNVDKLQIGQAINLSVSEPYLNVETTIRASFDEDIPYDTKYVDDGSLYRGQTKTVESGQYGIKKVLKEITKINGKEVAVSIINAAVVKNPVARVLARGTKQLVGSGMFQWPVAGRISSGFGSRGREYHKGVDIAASIGTPIYAADGGTVTFSGRYSGYGNLVMINHGNGYVTYYGHCSSLYVKQGQTVTKGQKIASVGMTGWATGPHVHFEVRVNGSVKNPLNYLK